jgi:F0F1-type ATP synthase gamma subunit
MMLVQTTKTKRQDEKIEKQMDYVNKMKKVEHDIVKSFVGPQSINTYANRTTSNAALPVILAFVSSATICLASATNAVL